MGSAMIASQMGAMRTASRARSMIGKSASFFGTQRAMVVRLAVLFVMVMASSPLR